MNAVQYKVTRLANGVTVATAEMPHMESACLGMWALTGSRHESPELNGIAHFVEHLLFKGTPSRTAYGISREIEGLGASIGAFTTEDHTCFHSKGPAETLPYLASVLIDMYANPAFDPAEIEREREVILEEISMYRDNPSQHVEDLLGLAAWPEHPLGLPITGLESTVSSIGRGDLFAYHQERYTGVNTLVTASGKVSHEAFLDLVGPVLEALPTGRPVTCEPFPSGLRRSGPRRCDEARDIEQAHICIGLHGYGRREPQRFALKMLSVLLGENMSSRLFQVLREETGLCYSVFSDMLNLEETGLLNIYAGLDVKNVPRALDLVAATMRDFIQQPIPDELVQQAITYTIGQSRMDLENSESQMMWCGESLIAHGRVVEPVETFERLARVQSVDVRGAAEEVFQQDGTAIAYIGPEIPEFALNDFLA